jgi:hypothetical protein
MENVLLHKIVYKNLYYELLEPIKVEITCEKYFLANNNKFCIYSFGKTKEEAIVMFQEEFDFIYNRYNQLDDSLLTEKVIDIKKELNKVVKKIIVPNTFL